MSDVFQTREASYNLRNMREFKTHCVKTVHYGTESVSFLGPKLWQLLPQELKDINDINIFKSKIKEWVPQDCPCRLCKTYVHQLGFVEK